MTPDQIAEFDRIADLWGEVRFVNQQAKAFCLSSGLLPYTWLLPVYEDFSVWSWFLLNNNRSSEIITAFNDAVTSGLNATLLRELLGLLGFFGV
jgi:hypothetical protein